MQRTSIVFIGILIFILNFCGKVYLFFGQSTIYGLTRDGGYLLQLARSIFKGEGFVSYSAPLFQLPESFPCPYCNTNGPLTSLIVAGAYLILGQTWFASNSISLIAGSLIPSVTFYLAFKLTRSIEISLLSAFLCLIHPGLFLFSFKVGSVILFICLSLACFYFLIRGDSLINAGLAGLFLGLSYLTRYQAVLMIPVILLHLLGNDYKRKWRYSVMLFGSSLIVIAPWLIRNYVIFGDPTYVFTKKSFLLLGIDSLNTWQMETLPNQYEFILNNKSIYLNKMLRVLQAILFSGPVKIGGGYIISLFSVIGIIFTIKAWRKYIFAYAYILISLLFVMVTYFEWRYLYSLIPLFLIFSMVGFVGSFKVIAQYLVESR